MSGTYERIGDEPARHVCRKPGWWSRRWHRAGIGTVWRCGCGRRYVWREDYLISGGPLWMPLDEPFIEDVLDKVFGPPLPGRRLR